jgi:hypothetical protein
LGSAADLFGGSAIPYLSNNCRELGLIGSSFSGSGFQADVIGDIKGNTVVIRVYELFDWSSINPTTQSLVIGTNGVIRMLDAEAKNHPARFYCAILQR